MNEARVAWLLGRRPARKPARVLPATCRDGTLTAPVEIAVPGFRAELVEGSASAAVIRLHLAEAGSTRRLPAANVRHEGRVYVIPAPTPDGQRPGGGDLAAAA